MIITITVKEKYYKLKKLLTFLTTYFKDHLGQSIQEWTK